MKSVSTNRALLHEMLASTSARLFATLMLLACLGPLSGTLFDNPRAEEAEFSQAELDQMLAPIALYPDTILSHVLIAATYPLDVVQAARWWQSNRDLSGESAVNAVEYKDWNPSIKALVAFPEIVARMNEDLEWTETLGEAFIANEADVLARIQALREQAYAAGNLKTLEHFKIERNAQTIIIEPAETKVVYIPYYDPRIVYGSWHWNAYPPVHWDYPRGRRSHHRGHNHSVYWSAGISLTPHFFTSSVRWHLNQVVVLSSIGDRHRSHFYSSRQLASHHDAHPWRDHRAYRHNWERNHRRGPVVIHQPRRDHRDIHFGSDRRHDVIGHRDRPIRIERGPGHVRQIDSSERRPMVERDRLPSGGVIQRDPRSRSTVTHPGRSVSGGSVNRRESRANRTDSRRERPSQNRTRHPSLMSH